MEMDRIKIKRVMFTRGLVDKNNFFYFYWFMHSYHQIFKNTTNTYRLLVFEKKKYEFS